MPKILPKNQAPAATTAAPTAAARVAAAQPGKKATAPAATTTPPPTNGQAVNHAQQPKKQEREVIYPQVECEVCDGENAITEETAKIILHWKTEAEFQQWMVEEDPSTKPEHWVYGEDYMLKDVDGNKVKCWHNLDNRPFDENWCRGLAQTILRGQWAGPLTIAGETINGSTIVLSRTGRVESGQHSLIALILACQLYRKNPTAYPFWSERGREPVIETIIVKGISENPAVTMTVDNCKPRSMADVFYTSDLFRNLGTGDRRECSKMMANASDNLYTRVAAQGYRTPPEMVAFVDRHPHLLKAVEHLFGENKATGKKTRPISLLRISPGLAASLCYLMGASGPKTDGDVYRNGFPPSEKDVDWARWSKAKEFWAMVGTHDNFKVVRQALAHLFESSADNEENLGMGGRLPERLAILEKAWNVFVDHDPSAGAPMFSAADLQEGGALYLSYNNLDDKGNALPDGQLKLLDIADFGGIDCPGETKGAVTGEPPPMTTAELQAEKEKVDLERARAATAARPVPSAKAVDAVAKLKALRKSK